MSELRGFNNELESEAEAGALPRGQFSPQRPACGLYAEKFSNTAFTAPAADNRRTWFYRIHPSAKQNAFKPYAGSGVLTAPLSDGLVSPEPLRWLPPELPQTGVDFVDSLTTVAANGDAHLQLGMAAHLFEASVPMTRRCFASNDGELLLVPQSAGIEIRTECGVLVVMPGDIALIPRGMKFSVDPVDRPARGYVCENYGQHFRLPERGPVGSDGFANARDFIAPEASYLDHKETWEFVCKYDGQCFVSAIEHNPFDVVAWVGTALPYRYALKNFQALGSISFDHPDPSIFTVLTAPSDTAGIANVDFVIFPPRWLVAENSFRPPWFHRNVMSEFMGLIEGQYDAKKDGFVPGGMSLHNALVPHGPDADVFAAASSDELKPAKLEHTMAFMFESRYPFRVSRWATASTALQDDYVTCWSGLEHHFSPPRD